MAIWAIADIHASRTDPSTGRPVKPMDVFGAQWADHVQRLERAWRDEVSDEDTVIVAGDIDWALHLSDARETLERLDRLPGSKILIRGNHDYWWSSKTTNRVRKELPPSLRLIHNEALDVEEFNICGAKGSPVPGGIDWTPENEKILNREVQRLETSLQGRDPGRRTIVAMHYPPFYPSSGASAFSSILAGAGVAVVVYGHLHGSAGMSGPAGEHDGVWYSLVAGDAHRFSPVLIARDGKIVHEGHPEIVSSGTGG
ncbi:MAG: metallophosphoesterase [Chloroflexota bacterium]